MKKTGALISRLLSRPEGIMGRVVAILMNRVNRRMYEICFELLGIRKGDRVLEIGFGNGKHLGVAAAASRGFTAGIDISETMVREAERRNRRLVDSGKMEISRGDVSSLPYGDDSFHKVYTLNTVYFWKDPGKALGEIRRVLKKGGTLVIGMNSREAMEKSGYDRDCFIFYDREEVEALVRECGLAPRRWVYEKMEVEDALCLKAQK